MIDDRERQLGVVDAEPAPVEVGERVVRVVVEPVRSTRSR
jgi:hypothetical protein